MNQTISKEINESFDQQLKLLQDCELETFKLFKKICDENNIRYYMIGGTLIGVIRHQGFIPWDDDIDVGLPRSDYNRFLEVAPNYLPEYMDLKTKSSDPNFKCYFTRFINNKKKIYWDQGQYIAKIGIWMDVFPIDGLPNNKLLREIQVLKVYWWKMLYKFTQIDYIMTNRERSKMEWILIKFAQITRIGNFLSADGTLNMLDKQLQKYDFDKCNYAWNYSGGHGLKEIMPKRLWAGKRTGVFEGLEVSIPENTEEHLTYIFGDYMKVPPENERVTHAIRFVENDE